MVPVDRRRHGLAQLAPRLAAVALGLVGVAEGDAGLGGQQLDRAGEVEVLDVADERDHVALGLAAEAVEDALLGVDRERRVFSPWNGHSPVQWRPAFFSCVWAEMTATMSAVSRTRCDVLVDDAHQRTGPHAVRRRSDGADHAADGTSGAAGTVPHVR